MIVSLDYPFSSLYFPFDSASEPFRTLGVLDSVVVADLSPSVKYGIMIDVAVQTLVINALTPTLRYGISISAAIQEMTISTLFPSAIGALWDRINKVTSIWTNIDKSNLTQYEVWTDVGSFLFSVDNYPFLSTYYPFLEGGGIPTTTYDGISKPTTSYDNIGATTGPTYTNIDKPSN